MITRAMDTEQDELAAWGEVSHPGQRRLGGEQVLFFSFNYPPHDGGVSRLCAELVAGLQRKGVAIHVLSQRREGAGSCIPLVPQERVTMRRPWRGHRLELTADLVFGETIEYAGLDGAFWAHCRLRRWRLVLWKQWLDAKV